MNINLDELTLADLADVEKKVGRSFTAALSDPNDLSATTLQALVWVAKRREDPDFTFEQAGRLPMAQVKVDGDGEVPPT